MVQKFVRRNNQFKKNTYGRRKRWYFNAGANLPFVGKTTVAFGTKSKRSILNVVRRGLEDPMHKLWSKQGVSGPDQIMNHNTLYTLNLTGNIAKGDDESDRSGENIHLDALKFRVHFVSQNGQVTNASVPKTYRVMIVKHDIDTLGGSDAFGPGLGAGDLFHGNSNVVWEWVSAKNCTVIYDKKVKITPQIGSTSYDKDLSDIVKFGTTFTYKPDQSYGKFHNYYLVICGYEPAGVTGTTNVGRAYFFGDLIFKDSK